MSTDVERREIARVLASYGPPLLHFADLVARASNDDVYVGSIVGPVPGSLVENYERRALVVSGYSDGQVAVVGLGRLAELVADDQRGLFTVVSFSDARRRIDSASLLLIHDGAAVVAAVGYVGPVHAAPAQT